MPWGDTNEIFGQQEILLARLLDTNGDGTGTKSAVGDYSTPEDFYIQPEAGEYFRIQRLIISIEDGTGIKAELYGGLAALANGITLKHIDDSGTLVDFTDGVPVKTNAHWGRFAFDVDVKDWGITPTNELLVARFSFSKFGQALRLDGSKGGKLVVTLSDNMTGIIAHYFMAEGYIEDSILP